MSEHTAQQPTMVSLSAVVIRADGRREELGTLAYWHRNPLRRWWWALKQRIAGRRPGSVSTRGLELALDLDRIAENVDQGSK